MKPRLACLAFLLISWGTFAHATPTTCDATQAAALKAMRAKGTSAEPTTQLQIAVLAGNTTSLGTAIDSLESAPATARSAALDQALAGAAWTGNQVAVDTLIARGAHPNATTDTTGSTPIVLAAQCGHIGAMASLTKAGASLTSGSKPDQTDNVPRGALEAALAGDEAEAAEWLVDHGYDVCRGGEGKRVSALLNRLGPSTAVPASLRAKLACQATKEK
ncbi:ankyrin repeat domain-containing protein [Luteibacter pinisoli]|uniref:Ankyrin repeat domain-containing protein n=1 Tax=Luteibacter pinisoli TaxID=2589080 RepID=A0A4Y5Z3X5_9GAMM|nr:ankyrin repeat domain-containing protein [Luteibacter pinisoli]QDE39794.1 ankyrin repeat domain-containing protein [Luteibacter pinisoli]